MGAARGRGWLVIAPAIALAAHARAWRCGFVLDDGDLLARNPYVRSAAGLRTLLSNELFVASARPRHVPYWRPLSGLVNWASWHLLGASAPAQHALNVALFALVVGLAARLMVARGASVGASVAAASLLAAHPACAEVVAYIGGRQWLVGAAILLATLLALPRARRAGSLAAACFAGVALATASHEYFASAAIVLAVDVALRETRARGAVALGGGAIAVALDQIARVALSLASDRPHGVTLAGALRGAVGVALRLAKDVVWPSDLVLNVSIDPPPFAASLAIAVGALAAFAWGARRIARSSSPPAGARALLGMAVALFASISALAALLVVQAGSIAERCAFVAVLAGSFVVAVGVDALGPDRGRRAAIVAVVAALAMLPWTWARDADWRSDTSLARAALRDRPGDPESMLAMGSDLLAANDVDGAYPYCVAYAQLRPETTRAELCIGAHALDHGDPRAALPHLRRAADAQPELEAARGALLTALFASGDLDEVGARVDSWEPRFPGAPDLAEARAVLAKRRAGR